jgi:hypothetical protein
MNYTEMGSSVISEEHEGLQQKYNALLIHITVEHKWLGLWEPFIGPKTQKPPTTSPPLHMNNEWEIYEKLFHKIPSPKPRRANPRKKRRRKRKQRGR